MLSLLGLQSRFKNRVELLSFTRYLILQRRRKNLVVFIRKEIDLLSVVLFNLLNIFSLFSN